MLERALLALAPVRDVILMNAQITFDEHAGLEKATPVSSDELIAPLAAGMPEPTDSPIGDDPTVVEHDRRTDIDPKPQVDSAGVVFDPERHRSDADGRPKTNVKGRFYPRTIGRRPKRKTREAATFASLDDPEHAPSPPSERVDDRFDVAAELYCRTGYGIAVTAFADEGWLPENDSEHSALRDTVAAYLRATNRADLPPGLALALGLAAYAGKRIARPKTSSKLRSAIRWLRKAIGREAAKEPEEATS